MSDRAKDSAKDSAAKDSGNDPSPLLGVSRAGRDRFSLREFLKSLFGRKRPQARQPKLPRPSRAVLASRTTAELPRDERKK